MAVLHSRMIDMYYKAKVYSAGFYLDKDAAISKCKGVKTTDPIALSQQKDFEDVVRSSS